MEETPPIYQYILDQERFYQQTPVPIIDGYEWNMFEHIKRSTMFKNSRYETGKLGDKPFKNIIRPVLNVAYRAEGFDVKDIQPYVDNVDEFYKSFLVQKFHGKWARKNDIDTFIDDLVESYVDYGGALVKRVRKSVELVPLPRIAFVDQTDILSSAICEKHAYSPDQLVANIQELGWYADKVDYLITMAQAEKSVAQTTGGNQKAKTPGRYIEIYEIHGMLPAEWYENGEPGTYTRQYHAIGYYKNAKNEMIGVTLFAGKEKKIIYKFLTRDKIYGRALGFGGIEELFEPQVWTNYSIIQVKEMLDVASLMILQTADKKFASRNKTTDLSKGEILVHAEGMPVTQVGISPVNMEMFNNSMVAWENAARTTGSANEAILGENPASGTPFALQALVNTEGHSLHEWRKGKISTFLAELYRDWILQDLVDEMNNGHEFAETLSLEEMKNVADSIVTNHINEHIIEQIMNGKIVTAEDRDSMIAKVKADFMKGGSKRFIKIMEDEIKDIPTDVDINIAGKQKDLAKMSEKLTNVFRQVMTNPQILQIPQMAQLFNRIMEYSGLSPIDFGSMKPVAPATPPAPAPGAQGAAPAPAGPAMPTPGGVPTASLPTA